MGMEGHELVQEGDLVRLTFHGPLKVADAEALRAYVEEVLRVAGRCFLLVDMSGLTVIEPDARRAIGEWGRLSKDQVSAAAIHGASFALRVVVTLMLNAIRVLARRDILTFFARDEAEATAWLTERRRQLVGGDGAHRG